MRCFFCYKKLESETTGFHAACSRRMFGQSEPPTLPYNEDQILELGERVIKSQVAVTGVQPKLSLDLERQAGPRGTTKSPQRFTIVGLWGGYILKPPTKEYPHLPEVEDLTMHLAAIAGVNTVPHSLIPLQSGSLAYITRRIDREKGAKLPMEDMCQLTERLTEDKYKGSHEQIAKAIIHYTENPVLDVIDFFEQVIFCFLTGNADMHLKNFSLLRKPGAGYTLAPAYDMVATALLVKNDMEELALNLNGKKRKLTRRDFDQVLASFRFLDAKAVKNMYKKFSGSIDKWLLFIDSSFIPEEMKTAYVNLIKERAKKLEL